MAHGVLNIMASNYAALEDIFKGMGVLSTTVDDLRRPGVDEPFATALQRCMSGEAPAAEDAADMPADAPADASAPARKRIVQDADGADRRRAFGQLYEEVRRHSN